MTESNPRLVVRQGTAQEKEYELTLATIILGREPINDVVFTNPEVSRRHARLMKRNAQYVIEDLGSTNGTYVNGRRLDTAVSLNDGDIIDLGETIRLTYVALHDRTEPAIKKPPVVLPNASSTLVNSEPAAPASSEATVSVPPESDLAALPLPSPPDTAETDDQTRPSWWLGLLILVGLALLLLILYGAATLFF